MTKTADPMSQPLAGGQRLLPSGAPRPGCRVLVIDNEQPILEGMELSFGMSFPLEVAEKVTAKTGS